MALCPPIWGQKTHLRQNNPRKSPLKSIPRKKQSWKSHEKKPQTITLKNVQLNVILTIILVGWPIFGREIFGFFPRRNFRGRFRHYIETIYFWLNQSTRPCLMTHCDIPCASLHVTSTFDTADDALTHVWTSMSVNLTISISFCRQRRHHGLSMPWLGRRSGTGNLQRIQWLVSRVIYNMKDTIEFFTLTFILISLFVKRN